MAVNPTKSATFDILACNYGAIDFQDALANFLAYLNNPGLSTYALRQRAEDTLIPFRGVPVFHKIKFTQSGHLGESEISDTVYAQPEGVDTHSQIIPAHFDTIIVHQDNVRGQGNKSGSFISKEDA